MGAWTNVDAVAALRRRIGDGETDKFEFKADCLSTPNSIGVRFFCGRTRVVPETVRVYVADVEIAPTAIFEDSGEFELAVAPSGTVQASFYYRWFTDRELEQYVMEAAQNLGYTDTIDPDMPVGVRAAVLDFASAMAYTRKAAEYAEYIAGAAAGYSVDQSRPSPNWRALAEGAWKQGKEKVDLFVNNPLTGKKPSMRRVTFHLPNYMPGS